MMPQQEPDTERVAVTNRLKSTKQQFLREGGEELWFFKERYSVVAAAETVHP